MTLDIRRSAFKHGVPIEDTLYVVEHALRIKELEEEPQKLLFLGFTADGIPLEVIVVEDGGRYTVIHSMRMRTTYKQMLNEGE